MSFSPIIDELTQALSRLPGIGPKSAQRITLHILEKDKKGGIYLAKALEKAIHQIQHCRLCRILTELEICKICANPHRDNTLLCIVENPIDVIKLERIGHYRGYYFVLMGHLSPIDGIGPADIGMDALKEQLQKDTLQELIVATNPTVEGEATAHYIAQLARPFSITVSRIAHGVPLGGELEYLDDGTLATAMANRQSL